MHTYDVFGEQDRNQLTTNRCYRHVLLLLFLLWKFLKTFWNTSKTARKTDLSRTTFLRQKYHFQSYYYYYIVNSNMLLVEEVKLFTISFYLAVLFFPSSFLLKIVKFYVCTFVTKLHLFFGVQKLNFFMTILKYDQNFDLTTAASSFT